VHNSFVNDSCSSEKLLNTEIQKQDIPPCRARINHAFYIEIFSVQDTSRRLDPGFVHKQTYTYVG
jgi:hypothetical protein